MPKPFSLAGLSRREMGAVYEQTLAAEYLRWARRYIATGGEGYAVELVSGTEEAPGIAFAGPPGAHVALTFGHGYDGPVEEDLLARIERLHERTGGTPIIEVSPYAGEDFVTMLRVGGYGPYEYLHTYAMDLETFEPPEFNVPSGWRMRDVDKADEDDIDRAVYAIAWGMNGDLPGPTERRLEWARMSAACPDVRTLIIEDEKGEIVAGSSAGMWFDHPLMPDGNCNLYGGTTMPKARRKGLQSVLMIERLLWAKEHGCRTATLDCLPTTGTTRNAERLGFELLYTKIDLKRPDV
ncbi:MAG: GNAT family N-acetyltransferase [Planctomycetota bacterium]